MGYGNGYKVYKDVKDQLKLYDRRLQIAEKKFKEWEPDVKKRYKRYRQELLPTQVTADGHRISTPSGTATIDSLFSSLTAVQVDLEIENIGQGTRDQAYVTELGLKQEWRVTKAQRKSHPAIKDALIADIGWVKTYYEYAEHDEAYDRSEADMQADIEDVYMAALDDGGELPDPAEVSRATAKEEVVTIVDIDRICVEYVPWASLRWDPTASRLRDIRWVAQVTKLPLEEVRENADYIEFCGQHNNGKKLRELTADGQLEEVAGQTDIPEDSDMVTVYEVWDLQTAKVFTYAKGRDFLLYEAPNPFAIYPDIWDRSPFVPCVLREDPESVMGVSDMRIIMPLLDELDTMHSNLATYVDRYTPKHLVKGGMLTESGKKALKSREYGIQVEVEQGYEPSTDHKEINPPPLPSEIFAIPQRLEQEIREATGVSDLMRGLFPEGTRRSATETEQVAAGTASRQSEKRNLLEEFYLTLARKILLLMQAFYDRERIARAVDEYGEFQWEWSNEDIVLDAELHITLTPVEEKTLQNKKDDAMALVNLLGPLPIVDQAALITYVLEEFNVPRTLISEIVKTPEDVQVQQQQELQVQGEQAAVAAGAPPNPTNLPGPFAGADVGAVANTGELPPNLAGATGAAPVDEGAVAALLQ
jgi:hypothetical protein